MATATEASEGKDEIMSAPDSMDTLWPRKVHWDFHGFALWLQASYQKLSDTEYEAAMKRYDYLETQAKASGYDPRELYP